MSRRLLLCAAGAAFLLAAGCQQSDSRMLAEDPTNPHFEAAAQAIAERRFEEAAKQYEQASAANPAGAKAHYELGQIYGDRLNNPVKAMYHYQMYLELRPSAENRGAVEQLLETQKLTLASSLANSPVKASEELAKLQKQNDELRNKLEDAMAKLSEASTAVTAATSLPAASPAGLVPAAPAPPGAAASPAVSGSPLPAGGMLAEVATETTGGAAPAAVPAGGRQHEIKKGDNLWKIAKQYYGGGDINAGIEKIKTANPDVNPQNLKIGTVLTIPD
jgi:LysM repeat protein